MTTVSSGNITSQRLVSQAILNITQSTTQGVLGIQKINLNCNKNTKACNNCLETAKYYNLINDKNYSKICNVCFCTLENVNIKNIITVDMESFKNLDSSQQFQQQVRNSITQMATMNGFSLFNTGDGMKSLNKTSDKMYEQIKSDNFQNSFQQLKNFQILSINNPNTSIINVDLDLTIEFLSKILQENKQTSAILDDFETNILQLTTQTTTGPMYTIVQWIVLLVTIIIIVICFIVGIYLSMQVIELYAIT
jgi:hypothetical protein